MFQLNLLAQKIFVDTRTNKNLSTCLYTDIHAQSAEGFKFKQYVKAETSYFFLKSEYLFAFKYVVCLRLRNSLLAYSMVNKNFRRHFSGRGEMDRNDCL